MLHVFLQNMPENTKMVVVVVVVVFSEPFRCIQG